MRRPMPSERWSGSIEDFYRYARENDAYGGIPDLWAITGKRLWIWDWKTGKRYPKWEQLRDYALYGALSFPGVDRVTGTFVWLTQGLADADIVYGDIDMVTDHRTKRRTRVWLLNLDPAFRQAIKAERNLSIQE